MITLYPDKHKCCGCTACKNICPKKAISMQKDDEGFFYPVIDNALCVECGKCQKICEFQNKTVSGKKPLFTYAAINKNFDTLENSSSGGVFAALAAIVLEKGGIVFGCAWNTEMEPEHICINNPEDMKKLQGSKYVQSNPKNTYTEAKQYLQGGKAVLYTGTPCQIAGLKSYLGKDYENLITADLICHGVPSADFFRGYKNWLEEKLNGKIESFKFRDKSKVGMGCVGKVTLQKNGKRHEEIIAPPFSSYYQFFLQGDIYRKCCYNCKYACSSRQGDFTMGDYWGIEKVHPEIDDRNGVSVLLVNSEKGLGLIDKLAEYLSLAESTFEKASVGNRNLLYPTNKSDRRGYILRIFSEGGFRSVDDYYRKTAGLKMVLYKMKAAVPVSIKKKIRKLLGRIGVTL